MDKAKRRISNNDKLRIVVSGYIIRGPLGGLTWHHLQYVMGFAKLGHEVYFVEDSDDYPSCYDPSNNKTDIDPSYGLKFASHAFNRVGLNDRWAYYDAHRALWLGPRADNIIDLCLSANLLLNLSGVNPLRAWFLEIPKRVLVDTDPAFTQIRHLINATKMLKASQHTKYLTFGENFGRQGCDIPDDGFDWKPTRQPVVLDAWTVTPGKKEGKFTTVMQWDSYPSQEYQEKFYGMKSESFRNYLDLPDKVKADFELALGSASAPRDTLKRKGWQIVNPLDVTKDPWTYQEYIQKSKAEFGIAKHGYVVSNSGWFSERSAVYLASGRPVIVQDSGFTEWMETGAGVLAFKTFDEAVAAIEEVNSRYEYHCKKAREIAEEYFDSKKVLTNLIEKAI
ncbi:MAG: hypothetical protein JW715_13235 [Sedimentisphaerales bacterium]|nr:hypothetical protein [Sedimentisphaerales bacterium]